MAAIGRLFCLAILAIACVNRGVYGACSVYTPLSLQLHWLVQAEFAGYYAALDKGYFRDECLSVSILGGSPAIDSIQQLSLGAVHMAVASISSLLTSIKTRSNVLMVGQFSYKSALRVASFKSANIPAPKDWANKTIAVWPDASPSILYTMLKSGVNRNNVRFTDFGLTADLTTSNATAAMTFNEIAQLLETIDPKTQDLYKLDSYNIYDVNEMDAGMIENGIFVNTDWLATASPTVVIGFLRAAIKGWIECRENPRYCVNLFVDKSAHQVWMINEMHKVMWPAHGGLGNINVSSVDRCVEIIAESTFNGNMSVFDGKHIYNDTYALAAVSSLVDENLDVFGLAATFPELSFCLLQKGGTQFDLCSNIITTPPPHIKSVNFPGGSNGLIATVICLVVGVVIVVAVVVARVFILRRRRIGVMVNSKQNSQIKYEELSLGSKIGRGAFGEVYKAIWRGTEVAVKKLYSSDIDAAQIEQFMVEADMMCGLRHPNVVLFMGAAMHNDRPVIVAEFMPRGSLLDVLQSAGTEMSYPLQIHIASAAASGINFLHHSKPPILHRDIKSGNILVDNKWNVKISDFGISHLKNSDKNKGGELGTVSWTAPEVLEGTVYSEKSDVFSFGMVLWEIFHQGADPYPGFVNRMAVALAVKSGLRPTVDSSKTPPEINDLIMACLHADVSKRPNFAVIAEKLQDIALKHPFNYGDKDAGKQRPTTAMPSGKSNVYVFTDIESSSQLWEDIPYSIQSSLELHNKLLRENLVRHGGYEVRFEGDAFFVVFSSVVNAVNWCVQCQIDLLSVNWPEELLQHECCQEVTEGADVMFRGLRVRMGFHIGDSAPNYNNVSKRMDFFGTAVNKSARIAAHAKGGQILVSSTVSKILEDYMQSDESLAFSASPNVKQLLEPFDVVKDSDIILKGINGVQAIYAIKPQKLGKRTFAPHTPPESFPSSLSTSQIISKSGSSNNSGMISYTPANHGTTNNNANNKTTNELLHAIHVINHSGVQASWYIPFHELQIQGKTNVDQYSETFKASWNGSDVSVKVPHFQTMKEDSLLNFRVEVNVLSKLDHPNIIKFIGACLDHPNVCIVTEYIDNGTLQNLLLGQQDLTLRQKVKLAFQIASGLHYLHTNDPKRAYIHRDINSNSILVTSDLNCKITNFGMSKLKENAKTTVSYGEISWTAPELLLGRKYTEKADVYSYGVVLWEIYCRQVPYVGLHSMKAALQVITGFRPEIPSHCPQKLKTIIECCLKTDPGDRPFLDWVIHELMEYLDVL